LRNDFSVKKSVFIRGGLTWVLGKKKSKWGEGEKTKGFNGRKVDPEPRKVGGYQSRKKNRGIRMAKRNDNQ